MRLWPTRKSDSAPGAKSTDVLPEWLWDQVNSQGILAPLPMSMEQAVGLPALLAVVRLIAHAAGLVPMQVFRGQEGQERTRAIDAWQWRLLNRRPGPPPLTPFAFKADIAANFSGRGNAYIRKIKPLTGVDQRDPRKPRVLELMPLNAARVKAMRARTGAVIFEDSTAADGKPVMRGTDEVIQVRSFSVGDGLEGLAPITAARLLVQAGLRRHQFEERHMANGIFPGIGLKMPPGVTPADAERWIELIESQHQSTAKAGKVIAVGGGAELVPIPISLEDAQFAEATRLTIVQAASIYQVPLSIVSTEMRKTATDDDWRHFTTFALGPVFTAMAEAFEADDDLFHPGADDELSVVPDPDAMVRLDPLKKAQIQKEQIQVGTRLVDELRAADGWGPLPPVPDDWTQEPGKVPQITPVGGAANPEAPTAPADDPQDNPDD